MLVMSTLVYQLVLLLTSYFLTRVTQQCEVSVGLPWQTFTYVQQNSSVSMNCTNETSQGLHWLIHLTGRESTSLFDDQSSISLLHELGIYEVKLATAGDIQLFINMTEENNGTVIQCIDTRSGRMISETTLMVPKSFIWNIQCHDVYEHTVKIYWGTQSSQDVKLEYVLSVSSNNTQPHVFQTYKPSHEFSAPDCNLPCEVYIFSITATYVGATYNGDDCSTPSSVFSRMLPSLPDKEVLEFNLTHSLVKEPSGLIILQLFTPTKYYCEDYPPINYTLGITNASVTSLTSFSVDDNITAHLLEDMIYTFKLWITNSVGTISSSNRTIYTTDVQRVTVTTIDEVHQLRVECEFICGSNALGCQIMMVGSVFNTTLTVTRQNNQSIANITHPLHCFKEILAFDIDKDGTIGSLAVKLKLENTSDTALIDSCSMNLVLPTSREITLLIGLVLLFTMLTFTVTVLVMLICIVAYKFYMRSRLKQGRPPLNATTQGINMSHRDSLNSASLSQTQLGNDPPVSECVEYSKMKHSYTEMMEVESNDCATYAHLFTEDHLYHELEARGTIHSDKDNAKHALHVRGPELPSAIVGDFIQHQEHPPIYQEITDLPVTKQSSRVVIH